LSYMHLHPHRSPSPPPDQDPSEPTPPPTPGPTRPSQSDGPASSTAFSAGSEFAADPGPPFDPDASPAEPELDVTETWAEDPHWEEKTIREALTLQGELLHSAAEWRLGVDGTDIWLHTERDLAAIAPPLTRILNRYDVTRAAAAAGDEGLLAAAILRYGSRNVIRTRRVLAARRAEPDRPRSGAPAEPETGPEFDEEWQRTHPDGPFGGPPPITPKGRAR
jgi:hypothetical protein